MVHIDVITHLKRLQSLVVHIEALGKCDAGKINSKGIVAKSTAGGFRWVIFSRSDMTD